MSTVTTSIPAAPVAAASTTAPAHGLLNQLEIRPQNEQTAAATSLETKGGELNSAPLQYSEVKTFTFGDMSIRMVQSKDNSEPLFCLADICKGCGLQSPNKVIKQIQEQFGWGVNYAPHLEADKQADSAPQLPMMYLPDALGRLQMSTMVTEAQMYFVIMRGRSAASKRFCNWICSEVIPSIRRTGSYSIRVRMPEKNEDGKFDVTYTAFATDFCNKLGLRGEERAAFQWVMERAKQQGIAIGFSLGGEKERERHAQEQAHEAKLIEADNERLLQLQEEVRFFRSEAERFQKLDSLKGGALSVLVQYPNDSVVRMLAKQILGLNQDQN